MKRFASSLVVVLFAARMSTWSSAPPGAVGQSGLAGLRQATALFHDLGDTLDTGRVDLHLCFDHMGQHYANPDSFADGILDPVDPEAMVYSDDGAGHLRLVAVEWISTTPGTVPGMGDLHFNPVVQLW